MLAGALVPSGAKLGAPPDVACGELIATGLNGVASVSASNAWAVGLYLAPSLSGAVARTLVEHWNGAAWTKVTSPNASPQGNVLSGVAALSPSDAWAVGNYVSGSGPSRTLVEHWNGTAWSIVPSPDPGKKALLYGVASRSASDAWAVGDYWNGTANQTLVLQWNGARWRQAASPNPGGSANWTVLDGVAATSSSNAWAVGCYWNSTGQHALVLHWNGTDWRRATSPNPGGSASPAALNGVAATSASSAWAVGEYSNGTGDQTVVLHWNGTGWRQAATPTRVGPSATTCSWAWPAPPPLMPGRSGATLRRRP